MRNAGDAVEPTLIGLTLIVFAAYHFYLVYRIRNFPLKTAAGQVWKTRQRWCQIVMGQGLLIEGIQTIRNMLMATSVLASTSLALSSVVVAFIASRRSNFVSSSPVNLQSSYISDDYRLLTVLVFFSCAFFCFIQSIRSGNHCSFLLVIPADDSVYSVTPAYIAKVLNRGAMFYTIGTRFFFLALLGVFWLFGPVPPFAACLVLVLVLHMIDRYPDTHYHSKSMEDMEQKGGLMASPT